MMSLPTQMEAAAQRELVQHTPPRSPEALWSLPSARGRQAEWEHAVEQLLSPEVHTLNEAASARERAAALLVQPSYSVIASGPAGSQGIHLGVLPPAGPEEALQTEANSAPYKAVDVPAGWVVLSKSQPDFEVVLQHLAAHRWGALAVVVKNARGGFDAYRTAQAVDGPAGSLQQANISWVYEDGDRLLVDCKRGRIAISTLH
eukprot:TRINITY_DN65625_c0_g1_i2.p1 TRINITY_DN65625_c0_g1~~TRINITY_DN65625_c0_g1_i2.p1  ORF type:complete len:203 (+),score=45.62 TRINITY_DN65625_c0_g1_i2:417-1025(+)